VKILYTCQVKSGVGFVGKNQFKWHKIMKNNKKIKPFYEAANNLLKIKIRNFYDLTNFYVGANKLALQIYSNSSFVNDLSSGKYKDNPKLLRGVNRILGYGQMIDQLEVSWKQPPKELDPSDFLEKNPQAKKEIRASYKEAKIFFNKIKKATDSYSREEVDRMMENRDKKIIEQLREEIKEIMKAKTSAPAEEEIKIGPLKYKYPSVFYNDSRLDLTPQLVRLCRLFMDKSRITDTYASEEAIMEAIETTRSISHKGMQKLISKLRLILKGEDRRIKIKRFSDQGYILEVNNIR
jgi:hypothetical protein